MTKCLNYNKLVLLRLFFLLLVGLDRRDFGYKKKCVCRIHIEMANHDYFVHGFILNQIRERLKTTTCFPLVISLHRKLHHGLSSRLECMRSALSLFSIASASIVYLHIVP